MLAPIVLFVYNRLDHTRLTVEALANNGLASEADLYVFADGPKNRSDVHSVEEVGRFIEQIDGFKRVAVKASAENNGLANSIVAGVSSVLSEHESVIVLEDDIVTSPYFLTYMNEALELYRNQPKVVSIHAYTPPIDSDLPETFFLRGADCWGWATWRHGWTHFRHDANLLFEELVDRNLGHAFDLDGAYPYMRMLADNAAGKNDSWAIRWHASTFLKGLLTLYPGNSLVQNIGLDGSGTHCGSDSLHQSSCVNRRVHVGGIEIEEDWKVREEFSRHYRLSSPEISIRSRLGQMLGRLIAPLRSKRVSSSGLEG